MPTFTQLAPFKLEMLDGSLNPMGHGRPAGRHLSEITRAMKEAMGENVTGIAGDADSALRPLCGFLFERCTDLVWLGVPYAFAFQIAWAEYMAVAKVEMPVERGAVETQLRCQLEGILGTPDGLATQASGRQLVESYKGTWKSMRKWEEDPEEHFGIWMIAESSYLKMLQAEGKTVDTIRFFILWMNGDYSRKPGRGAQVTFTDVQFSQNEIDRNWLNVLTYRDWLDKKEGGQK